MEGLLVILRRLAYPAHLRDLCEEFGRSKPLLSLILNQTKIWLWNRRGDLLLDPFSKVFNE